MKLAIILALSLTTSAAVAETAEERSACIGDAFSFCLSQIPSHARVEACLHKNIRSISAACRRALAGEMDRPAKPTRAAAAPAPAKKAVAPAANPTVAPSTPAPAATPAPAPAEP